MGFRQIKLIQESRNVAKYLGTIARRVVGCFAFAMTTDIHCDYLKIFRKQVN
jgi:hypothetical protein